MQRRRIDLAVISDLHLGTYGCQAEELVRYLKSIEPRVLILNGDIIDCWQFRPGYFPSTHMEVIKQFSRLAAKGTPVFYLTGNHDDVFRRFSDVELGPFQLRDQLVLTVGGERVLFFHGDVFDVSIRHARWLAQLGGRSYESIIRLNRLVNRLLDRLGRPRVSFSQRIKRSVKKAVQYLNDFEQGAVEYARRQGCSTVVCGHIHQPVMRLVEGAEGDFPVRYLNSGDWVENLSALEYHGGAWHLWHYHEQMAAQSGNEASAAVTGATQPEPSLAQRKPILAQPEPSLPAAEPMAAASETDPALAEQPASAKRSRLREEVFSQLDQIASIQLLLERERYLMRKGAADSSADY